MYARIENDVIVEYPLTEYAIRRKFPNVSFAQDISNHLPQGFVKIHPSVMPNKSEYVDVKESTPKLIDGKWTQVFQVIDKYTKEELKEFEAKKIKAKWEQMRGKRNLLLAESDYIVSRHQEQKELLLETTLTNGQYMAWLSYRQKLRNLPQSTEDIEQVVWPSTPGRLGEE